jgi:hypothetical protein
LKVDILPLLFREERCAGAVRALPTIVFERKAGRSGVVVLNNIIRLRHLESLFRLAGSTGCIEIGRWSKLGSRRSVFGSLALIVPVLDLLTEVPDYAGLGQQLQLEVTTCADIDILQSARQGEVRWTRWSLFGSPLVAVLQALQCSRHWPIFGAFTGFECEACVNK